MLLLFRMTTYRYQIAFQAKNKLILISKSKTLEINSPQKIVIGGFQNPLIIILEKGTENKFKVWLLKSIYK